MGVFALLSGVLLAELLGSSSGLDGFFIGTCAAFMVCVDQTLFVVRGPKWVAVVIGVLIGPWPSGTWLNGVLVF